MWTGGNVTETISSPNAEYVNYETKEVLGSSISYPYGGDYKYAIISKLPYDAQPEITQITGALNGQSGSVSYEIPAQSKFSIRENTISYSDVASLELDPRQDFMNFVKADLRIVSGGEYASFLSTETWQIAGDDIEVYSNDLSQYYLIMDNQPDVPTNVIVEYEVTGNIQRDTIKVMPYLQVNTEPEMIAPSDTAEIILKTWSSYEGKYISTPGFTFEVGIADNCGNGELLLPDGTRGEFFTELSNVKVKFVAADSTGSDSIAVKIKAGILDGGVASKSVSKGKYVPKTAKEEAIDSLTARLTEVIRKNFKSAPVSVKTCSAAEFTYPLTATTNLAIANIFKPWEAKIRMIILNHTDGTVFLGNKISYINNSPSYYPIYLNLVHFCDSICNSVNSTTTTIMGFVRTNEPFPFGTFELTSYRDYKNNYHFKINDDYFKHILVKDLCHSKFGSTALEIIDDINKITDDKLEEAKKQFILQYEYGKGEDYLLKEVIWMHEGIHEDDYKNAIPMILNKKIPPELYPILPEGTTFKSAFSSFTLPDDDVVLAEYTYRLIMRWFNLKLKETAKRSEQEVQNNTLIKDKISRYVKAIQDRINQKNKGVK